MTKDEYKTYEIVIAAKAVVFIEQAIRKQQEKMNNLYASKEAMIKKLEETVSRFIMQKNEEEQA